MKKSPGLSADKHNAAKLHCVTFMLAGDLFAIEIGFMREIIELESISNVPMMPRFVRGIINVRGTVVPVIDLSVRFGLGLTEIKPSTCVAILSLGDNESGYSDIGILLDAVCEVLEIPETEIEPSPTFGVPIQGDFIRGIATINERFAILLDVQRALSVSDLTAIAETVNQQHFNVDAEMPQ